MVRRLRFWIDSVSQFTSFFITIDLGRFMRASTWRGDEAPIKKLSGSAFAACMSTSGLDVSSGTEAVTDVGDWIVGDKHSHILNPSDRVHHPASSA